MKQKLFIVFLMAILLATGCQMKEQKAELLDWANVQDILTFTERTVDKNSGDVITQNLLIDKSTGNVIEVKVGTDFTDIFPPGDRLSAAQYYNDRMIMGSLNGGGHSIEFVKDADGKLKVNEYDFNILFYDETQKKYVTQTTPDDGRQGFKILNETMQQEDFIPLPITEAEAEAAPMMIDVYNLDTILYVGDVNGKRFQVQKYDMATKQWTDVAQLLSKEIYDGYEGFAYMSYNEKYPDWATFTINSLYTRALEQRKIDTLYFVNLKTGEMKQSPIPLLSESPIVTMPVLPVSFMQSKDRVVVLDMDPAGAKVLEELYVENLIPYGEQHINGVMKYDDNGLILSSPDGLIHYSFKDKKSEYVYTFTVPE